MFHKTQQEVSDLSPVTTATSAPWSSFSCSLGWHLVPELLKIKFSLSKELIVIWWWGEALESEQKYG